ncbi:hypothetical protein W822_16665 [Advenella kashmirensis W13003]|uniref:Uncharacterized protein n=1 Tax=Advenella kashmirensis W13003 TaxID=1424334 RepID=V8QS46_9BURK|nr:hypothetical protein W822_16665 [Advenella kashmirensis W13003]
MEMAHRAHLPRLEFSPMADANDADAAFMQI